MYFKKNLISFGRKNNYNPDKPQLSGGFVEH